MTEFFVEQLPKLPGDLFKLLFGLASFGGSLETLSQALNMHVSHVVLGLESLTKMGYVNKYSTPSHKVSYIINYNKE